VLAYFMTVAPAAITQSLYQPEQPAQHRSLQQVLVRAQQLAAAASSSQQQPAAASSSQQQPAAASSSQQLLPASAAATAQITKKRHRKQAAPVLSRSGRTCLGLGAAPISSI
jgi:hypothetical protein